MMGLANCHALRWSLCCGLHRGEAGNRRADLECAFCQIVTETSRCTLHAEDAAAQVHRADYFAW
jgi:hypothetical protein